MSTYYNIQVFTVHVHVSSFYCNTCRKNAKLVLLVIYSLPCKLPIITVHACPVSINALNTAAFLPEVWVISECGELTALATPRLGADEAGEGESTSESTNMKTENQCERVYMCNVTQLSVTVCSILCKNRWRLVHTFQEESEVVNYLLREESMAIAKRHPNWKMRLEKGWLYREEGHAD